jgi:tetratricopeptide (TPR) repeat protein
LLEGTQALEAGLSPIRQVFPKYPEIDLDRASSFKDLMRDVADFQARILGVRSITSDPQECSRQAQVLRDEYLANPTALPALGLELLYLVRDCVGWKEVAAYIGRLPKSLQELPVVREQLYLAQSKAGDHQTAIGALEKLIETMGDTSERRGLLGGRYKKLWLTSKGDGDLSKAIKHYDLGMRLDLNAYYPAGNLPRLQRSRARKEDEKLARHAAAVTRLACERARSRGKDNWALLTQLGAAFDEGDVEGAEKLAEEVADEGLPAWYIETTLPDLELSAGLVPDPEIRRQLEPILEALRKLVPKK